MIQITGGQMPISGGTLTGPLEIAVGSAAAPGLAVAGDSNTGLWAPAADTLAVSTAGVERLRLESGGNVGVGITTPSGRLQIFGDIVVSRSADPGGVLRGYNLSGGIGGAIKLGVSNTAGNQFVAFGTTPSGATGEAAFTEKMRVLSSGQVGIGTTAPTAALHLPASSTAMASLRIPAGTAPTIPNAGDVWFTGTVLKFFDGTTTKEIAFV